MLTMDSSLLAFIDGETLALFIPILALIIPIVAILTKHQQQMAAILNKQGNAETEDVAQLRRELSEVKALLQNQTIALDNLSGHKELQSPPPTPTIEQRLG